VYVHELSIAQSLIELACEAARDEGALQVVKLSVRIGSLSGVVKESLIFYVNLAAEDTACAGAVLAIEEVPLTVMCPSCLEAQTLVNFYEFRCPACGTPAPEVLTGRELDLVSIEVAGHSQLRSGDLAEESSKLPAATAQ
jgi:hydrogenase nickel incorporation protein HypA/HybF